MFCWNCGTKNADLNKFCGECGRRLARATDAVDTTEPPRPARPVSQMPERRPVEPLIERKATGPQPTRPMTPMPTRPEAPVVPPVNAPSNLETPGTYRPPVSPDVPKRTEPIPPAPTRMERTEPTAPPVTFAAPPPPTPVNPVAEEPRVVRERPIPVTPVKIEQPRTLSAMSVESANVRKDMVLTPTNEKTRIYGPSILGIGGDDSSNSESADYLLDDYEQPAERSTWRAWALLAVLALFGFLAYKQFGQGKNVKELFAQAMPNQTAAKEPVVSETDNTTDATKPTDEATAAKDTTTTAKAEPMQKPEGDDVKTSEADEKAEAAADKEPDGEKGRNTREEEGKPAQAIDNTAPKPSAAEKPDVATVELAQKYIQGRGVPQDCNRGFELLRRATERPNSRAHIQLGALYASGTCVEQDRALAYKHFAQAQSLDPSNTWIERNLNALWKDMTAAERQRAEREE